MVLVERECGWIDLQGGAQQNQETSKYIQVPVSGGV